MNADARAHRDKALTVACPEPRCNARPEQRCTNLATGEPLDHQAAHLRRLAAAGVDLYDPTAALFDA